MSKEPTRCPRYYHNGSMLIHPYVRAQFLDVSLIPPDATRRVRLWEPNERRAGDTWSWTPPCRVPRKYTACTLTSWLESMDSIMLGSLIHTGCPYY